MLKNIAFFGRNKIVKSLQTALNGGNRKFNLYFDRNEINIIDLRNRRFLYPKGAFVSVAQNIAQTPLNNDKWKIYANNLRLSKLQKNSAGGYGVANLNITAEAINKIVDIMSNSPLELHSARLSADSSLRGRIVDSHEAIQNFCDSKNDKNKSVRSATLKASSGTGVGVVREGEGSDFAIRKNPCIQAPTPLSLIHI